MLMFRARYATTRLVLRRSFSPRQSHIHKIIRSISRDVEEARQQSDKLEEVVQPGALHTEHSGGESLLDPWARQRSSEDPLKCTICSKTFKVKASVERHIAEVHKIPRPPGPPKSITVNSEQEVLDIWDKVKANPWACPICPKTFKVKANVERHIHTIHQIPKPPKPPKPTEKLLPQCYMCGKCFIDNRNLSRHVKNHTEKLQCSDCGALAPSIRELKAHVCSEKHDCASCDLSFTSDILLEAHMKVCKSKLSPGETSSMVPISQISAEQSPVKRRRGNTITPFIGPLRQRRTRPAGINDSFLGTHTRKIVRPKDLPDAQQQNPDFEQEVRFGDMILTRKEKANLTPSVILRQQRRTTSAPAQRVWTNNAQRKKRLQQISKDGTVKLKLSTEASQLSKKIKKAYEERIGKKKEYRQTEEDELEDSAVSQPKMGRRLGPVKSLDTKRVHVVSKELCDDIIERMRPSLTKHHGCDLIDINPGPGVWSSALHNEIKPRTHILMEPSHEFFKPILQPLLDAKDSTYKFIPKSGINWKHLNSVLTPEYLPHQTEFEKDDPRLDEPNDTLLVTVNLGYFPKTKYHQFASVAQLVQYTFMAACRSHQFFHKYGLVRMLMFISDDEKHFMNPKFLSYRRKGAVECEWSFKHVEEVASSTEEGLMGFRDHSVNLESSISAVRRMKDEGIITPKHRQGRLEQEASQADADGKMKTKGSIPIQLRRTLNFYERENLEARFAAKEFEMFPEHLRSDKAKVRAGISLSRKYLTPKAKRMHHLIEMEQKFELDPTRPWEGSAYEAELESLRASWEAEEWQKWEIPDSELAVAGSDVQNGLANFTPEFARLHLLRLFTKHEVTRNQVWQDIIDEIDYVVKLQKQLPTADELTAEALKAEIEERTESWKQDVVSLEGAQKEQFWSKLDHRKAWLNEPPTLFWDRRKAEPLKVYPQEFFPNQELALMDFHPKPTPSILVQNWPIVYEIWSFIWFNLSSIPTQSLREGLMALAPGAIDLVAECPSITDITKGGNPDLDCLSIRCMTIEMFEELLRAWVKWPFGPDRLEMLERTGRFNLDTDEGEVLERATWTDGSETGEASSDGTSEALSDDLA